MLQRWLYGRIATSVASAQPMPAEQFAGGSAMEIKPFGWVLWSVSHNQVQGLLS
jgi:hypothetical protein